jgi:hypothetical protein
MHRCLDKFRPSVNFPSPGTSDSGVQQWDVRQPACPVRFFNKGDRNAPVCLAIEPRQRYLYSAVMCDDVIDCWDLEDGTNAHLPLTFLCV